MQRAFIHGLLVAILLMSGGCGFQLRGSSTLPEHFNPLYLETEGLSPQHLNLLRNALRRASAQLSGNRDAANRLYVAFRGGQSQRLVQSASGGNELYRLNLSLDYRLVSATGEELSANQALGQSVDIELDSSNVLAHEQRLVEAREELTRGLIRNMIFQLNRQ